MNDIRMTDQSSSETREPGEPRLRGSRVALIGRTAAQTAVVLAMIVGVALIWLGVDVLLLGFAGLLMAIFLRGVATIVSEKVGLKPGLALLAVAVSLIGLLVLSVFLMAPGIQEQVDELSQELPRSFEHLKEYVGQYSWGRELLEQIPKLGESISGSTGLMSRVGGIFSSTLGVVANILIILAVGIYFSVEPDLYKNGLLKLIPLANRDRAREVIDGVTATLWWWIVGVMISMGTIGLLTYFGLLILGIPLALTLAVLTGLLAFIPNIGPISSAIPPTLLGLMISPSKALWVIGLYLFVQAIESNIVTPQVQKRTVAMPPVLAIVMQILFGVLFGFMGLLLAIPVTAAGLVLVKMLYVEDMLGDKTEMSEEDKREIVRDDDRTDHGGKKS